MMPWPILIAAALSPVLLALLVIAATGWRNAERLLRYAETPSRSQERAERAKVVAQEAALLQMQRVVALEAELDKVESHAALLCDELEHAREMWEGYAAACDGLRAELAQVTADRDDLLKQAATPTCGTGVLPEGELIVW